MVTEPLISNNGHEPAEETQEQLDIVAKKLDELNKPNSPFVTFGKQELGLLKQILSAATEEYKETLFWRMVTFLNDDEAYEHVAAFYEAKELGMNTAFNVAFAFALCSANRKGGFSNNLIAIMLDTMQMGKHAYNPNKKVRNDSSNPRSPIKD